MAHSHNRSSFFEALERTEARRGGGYKQTWGYSLSNDSEEARHDLSVMTMEEVERQQTSPEGKKSPSLRHFLADPLRTYERGTNNHSRPLNKLAPGNFGRRLGDLPEPTIHNRNNNYCIVSHTPTPAVVLQGRNFHHAIRKPVQSSLDFKERNNFCPTQQAVEVDSIVLTCPAQQVTNEDHLNIKRRVPQKRKPLLETPGFHSAIKPTLPMRPAVHIAFCGECKRPTSQDGGSKCQNCGSSLALPPSCQHVQQAPPPSSLASRPPFRSQPPTSPGPAANNTISTHATLAAGVGSPHIISKPPVFYGPRTTMRAPPMEILPVRITSARGALLPPHTNNANGRVAAAGLAGTAPSCCGARISLSTKGKRTAASRQQHQLNDPIVLSSDEEEDVDNASTGSVNRLDSVSPRPADSAHSSPAPSGGRVEAAVKSSGEHEDAMTSDMFSDVDMKISLVHRSRKKDMMINQYGKYGMEPDSPRIKKPKPSDKCGSIILECRSVRVGTLRRMVTKPVIFSIDHIQLETEPNSKCDALEKVSLRASELISCEWCCVRKLPVLFFQTTPEECLRLRTQLNMTREKGGQWYDSAEGQSDEKYIVLIFENGLNMKEQMILEDILVEIGNSNNLTDFPAKLTFDEANIRLVNYNKATKEKEEKSMPSNITPVPPVTPVTNVAQVTQVSPVRTRMTTRQQASTCYGDDEEEMGELQSTFSGPILKLIIYPPPPAKGGITVNNEDLHCLNDGEFLNDVIIDFYLKYVVMEKLKKEDAARIHVFSSFFYKRLNQRERRNVPDIASLPIQKKKHNRVKNWTRHVDLFQKDFIFVPINESAHWYLAVICFPGLYGAQYDTNPQYQGPCPPSASGSAPAPAASSSSSSLVPPSEDHLADHCRPLSPEGDGVVGSAALHRPPGGLSEAGVNRDQAKDSCAFSNGPPPETSSAAVPGAPMVNGVQGDAAGPHYTDGLHRISVSYGSGKGNDDTYAFSDDQSSCQDECSEDGTLAEEAVNPDNSAWTSNPTLCKQPCILIMDSLRGPARSSVVKTLREYLEVEWEVRKGSRRSFAKEVVKGSSPRVPQQDNFSDCGVYILQYVESFFENPIPSFLLPLNLADWFPQQRMKTKREEIRELILKIQTQQEQDMKESGVGPSSAPLAPDSPEDEEPEIEETLLY